MRVTCFDVVGAKYRCAMLRCATHGGQVSDLTVECQEHKAKRMGVKSPT